MRSAFIVWLVIASVSFAIDAAERTVEGIQITNIKSPVQTWIDAAPNRACPPEGIPEDAKDTAHWKYYTVTAGKVVKKSSAECAVMDLPVKYRTHDTNTWVWSEKSQEDKDQADADEAAAEAAADAANENAEAPDTGYANLDRRDKFMLRCLWRLAKEHWPTLTFEQFRDQLRTEWDVTKDE